MKKFILIFIFSLISINTLRAFQITNDKNNKKDVLVLVNYKKETTYFLYTLDVGKSKKFDLEKDGKSLYEIRVYNISLQKNLKDRKTIDRITLDKYENLLLMTIYKKEIQKDGLYIITNNGKSFAQEGKAKNA